MFFSRTIEIKQYRRAKLMKLSSDIKGEREKFMSTLDVEFLSCQENIEKIKKLEKLIIEYTYLHEGRQCSKNIMKVMFVTVVNAQGKIKENNNENYAISRF